MSVFSKRAGFMAVLTFAASIAALTPASAESLVITCAMVKRYSDLEVNYMLTQLRGIVGGQEKNRLYGKYSGLKAECQANTAAARVVSVSPALAGWLTQNGVDVRKVVASAH